MRHRAHNVFISQYEHEYHELDLRSFIAWIIHSPEISIPENSSQVYSPTDYSPPVYSTLDYSPLDFFNPQILHPRIIYTCIFLTLIIHLRNFDSGVGSHEEIQEYSHDFVFVFYVFLVNIDIGLNIVDGVYMLREFCPLNTFFFREGRSYAAFTPDMGAPLSTRQRFLSLPWWFFQISD